MKTLSLLLLSAIALVLPLLPINGLQCPVQGNDSGAICAMCSETNAAVRWTVAAKRTFLFFKIKYTCRDPNGTTIYIEEQDSCFYQTPIAKNSDQRTGVSSVGRELWAGVKCTFRLAYYDQTINSGRSLNSSCTIQSPEVCAAHPESCQIDRVSVMNEDGECPEHQCAEGYGGELCNNVNECETNNTCDEHADCHDTDGSYWCECRAGFLGDGYNCTDIDECVSLNETCLDENTHCVNSVGNFSCQCDPGFTGNGYNCSNINECESENACDEHADCHDTDGSYWCECSTGFLGDGYNCTDIDECVSLNETCLDENAHCVNSVGNFSCQCDPGFTGDGYNCSNINECESENACDEHADCHDTDGSYWCECSTGFLGDGYNCTDIDECISLNETCLDENAHCVNSVGNFSCQCDPGFTGDGYNCSDINECESENACDEHADCHDTDGSYWCECRAGFLGDGYNCSESSDSHSTAVVSGGISVVVLLLIIIILTAVVLAVNLCFKKAEKPSFKELTNMDLDPYYSPSFWKGSLTSFHSIYEKLDFSKSTTDITHYSENCEQQTNIESEDCASITTVDHVIALVPPSPTVEPTHGESCTQTQTTDYQPGEPSLQNQDELSPPTTNTNSTAPDIAIAIDAVSISDILASLKEDHTTPNNSSGLPASEENKNTTNRTLHTTTGYVADNGTASVVMEVSVNEETTTSHVHDSTSEYCQPHPAKSLQRVLHLAGSCATGYVGEDRIGRLRAPSSTDDRVGNEPTAKRRCDSTTSSGYATESGDSVWDRQVSCSSDALEEDDQRNVHSSSLHYVTNSVSSGYASESTMSKSISGCRSFSTTPHYREHQTNTVAELAVVSGCDEETPLYIPTAIQPNSLGEQQKLNDRYVVNNSCGTMSAAWEPHTSNDTVHFDFPGDAREQNFTVNAYQQSEYINAIKEAYLTDVCFDITP